MKIEIGLPYIFTARQPKTINPQKIPHQLALALEKINAAKIKKSRTNGRILLGPFETNIRVSVVNRGNMK